MSQLPVDVHIARMVVEGAKRGVVSDVIDIAACMEAGGIKDREGKALALAQNRESDLLVELEIFHAAQQIDRRQLKLAANFVTRFAAMCGLNPRATRKRF